MRINLKHLFVLIASSCTALAIYSSFVNREKRIAKAIILLEDVNANSMNPTKTSRAFRYLRRIGVKETKMAINRMDSDGRILLHLKRSLTFLFELLRLGIDLKRCISLHRCRPNQSFPSTLSTAMTTANSHFD